MVFEELTSNDIENLEIASDCIVELLQICNNRPKFESVQNLVLGHIEAIKVQVRKVVAE